ncbi:hypothetical protein [Helicobacter muridarum]|uniref:hypothetical protein n=1 Tax=Helicobacter muridarum TaxID=216 RepID=UPI000CF1C4E0|nr:hypothetical protein [Helicobacter muridarum]
MLNKLTRYMIIIWSIIFLSLCVTWVLLSYISHNKTYLGKLAVSNISFSELSVNPDNIKYLYTFKIIFPSNIFRYQTNISDIKISSLRLDNIECQYDNNTNTFTSTKSNSLDICNGIAISKLQRYIDISTKQIIDKQTSGEVSYSVQFSFRALVVIAIGYIVGIVFIIALRFNSSQNSFYIVDSTNKNPNIIGNNYPSPIKSFVVVLLIAICSMFLCYMLIDSGHDWGGDFSAYINQALSIMNGNVEAYKLENAFIIDNTHTYTNALYGPPTYPWGLSVMLIPFLHVFGLNFLWLKLLMIFHIGILLFSLYYFLLGRLPYFTLCVIVVFFACNYNILIYANYVISDLTFMAWCMVSIALLDSFLCHFHKLNCYSSANHIDVINKQISSSSLFKNDLFWFVLKGLLAGVAMFIAMSIRTNGIILPISLFCYYIFLFLKTRFTSSKLNFVFGKDKVNFNSSNSKHFKAKSQLLQSMPKSIPPPPI